MDATDSAGTIKTVPKVYDEYLEELDDAVEFDSLDESCVDRRMNSQREGRVLLDSHVDRTAPRRNRPRSQRYPQLPGFSRYPWFPRRLKGNYPALRSASFTSCRLLHHFLWSDGFGFVFGFLCWAKSFFDHLDQRFEGGLS